VSASAVRFALATEWSLAADVDRVWSALMNPLAWPRWWRYVRSVVDVAPGDAQGVGAIRRYAWTSRLPYTLVFDMRTTRVERPRLIQGEATGELEGIGRWLLESRGAHTDVRYDWMVDVAKPWMRALAPLFAPAFRWNHHAVMRAGGEGLARFLGTTLASERALVGDASIEHA